MFPIEEFKSRVNKVTTEMSSMGLSALIILDDEGIRHGGNLRYLTNVYQPLPPPRVGAAIITPAGVTVTVNPGLLDSSLKLANQISWVKNICGTKVGEWGHDIAYDIKAALHRDGVSRGKIGIDGLHLMTEPVAKSVRAGLIDFELVERTGIVEKLRMFKSPAEIEVIRESNKLNDVGIEAFMKAVKVGIPVDLPVHEAEYVATSQGAEWTTRLFMSAGTPYIWGWHHGSQVYKKGDMVCAEFNGAFEGYYGQVVRSFVVGKASVGQKHAYDTAVEAYQEAVSILKPGVRASELFATINEAIRKAGCEPVTLETIGKTGRGLQPMWAGHGIGVTVAEAPYLNEDDDTQMKPGFCIVIHPFVALEEGMTFVGNTLLVTETGCEELNKAEYRLEV